MASCFSISPLEPNLWKGINEYHYTIISFVLPCGMCTLSSVGRCTPDSRGRCYWVQKILRTHVCTPSTSIRPSSYSPEYILIQFDIFSFHQTIIFMVQINFFLNLSLSLSWVEKRKRQLASHLSLCINVQFFPFPPPWISNEIWNPRRQSFDSPSLSDVRKKGDSDFLSNSFSS